MVEDVEELRAKAEICFPGQAKLPLNREIGLRSSKAAQHVTAEVALLSGRRGRKGGPVENLAARIS